MTYTVTGEREESIGDQTQPLLGQEVYCSLSIDDSNQTQSDLFNATQKADNNTHCLNQVTCG